MKLIVQKELDEVEAMVLVLNRWLKENPHETFGSVSIDMETGEAITSPIGCELPEDVKSDIRRITFQPHLISVLRRKKSRRRA